MLLEMWTNVLAETLRDLWFGVVGFIPDLVVAIVIFVIGWVIGAALGRVVAQIISSLKVDQALRSAGVEDVLSRAGFSLNSGVFVGALVKWFLIITFLVASLEVLGLQQVNVFLQEVVLLYLPQVIIAVLILLVAAVVAEVVQNIVVGAAKAASLVYTRLLGNVARWSIWVFAILAALDHLGVASSFVQTLFTGIIVSLALAFGLSFGLGGQEAANRYVEKLSKEITSRE